MKDEKIWTGERLEPGVFNETTIEHLHRYALALEYADNKKVLDLACGEGYGSNLIAGKASEVVGVDNNSEAISQAKKNYSKQHNLQFQLGTVEAIPFTNNYFDLVISFETLEHVPDQDKMIQEIKRVTRPGGLLIMSTPDKRNYSDKPGTANPFHTKELYESEFRELLCKYFREVKMMDQQIAFSSVITSKENQGFEAFTGDYTAIRKDESDRRLYCIAFASDDPLPGIKNSMFNGQSIFAEAVTEKEKMVIGTTTYKLGHALLYPAKLIRKLFRKR